MGTVTLSAIKADVGGYAGHGDMHPDLLAEARSRVREAIAGAGFEIEERQSERLAERWQSIETGGPAPSA